MLHRRLTEPAWRLRGSGVSGLVGIEHGENLVGGAALLNKIERGFDGGIEVDDQAEDEQGDGGGGAVAGEDRSHADDERNEAEHAALEAVVLHAGDDSQDAAGEGENADRQVDSPGDPHHLFGWRSVPFGRGFLEFLHAGHEWKENAGSRGHQAEHDFQNALHAVENREGADLVNPVGRAVRRAWRKSGLVLELRGIERWRLVGIGHVEKVACSGRGGG